MEGEMEKGKEREREKEQDVQIVCLSGRTFVKGLSFESQSERR